MPLTRNQSNAASQARLAAANNSETSTSKETNDQGGTSADGEPPRRDSPENCSICLGPFNNKSFTSSCAHSFCFVCLKQWSKVKAECPLCKQPFTSIFHNIRSNQQYDIYELPHQPSNPVDYNNIFNYVGGPIPSFTAPTHHLFSLSQPGFDADLTLSNFSRFQFRHRRYDRYLNPLSIHGEHPYSFSGPSINPASHISAASWPRGPEEFRRDVYRRNLGPPAVILGCENSTYRLTPAMVAASAHRIHRIMPWLTRELRVLLRSHQNVRLAISIIQPLLTQVTIDSMFFYDKVAPLIGRRSRQFVQEFVAFANSALSIQAYDRKAMYRRRDVVSAIPSSSSNSSSENDVVEVTDISPEVFPIPNAPGPSQTQPLNLSRSGWDSPTPGPSWDSVNTIQDSALDRVSVSSESDDPVYRPDLRESDSDESKAGSDIIFVKYDKPWNERSPINLTSDSDMGEGNESSRKKKRSKHKKKKKELAVADNVEGNVSKKDKGKKSFSKSKRKDRSKSSKAVVSDEEKDSTEISKRRHSQSSTEHHRVKKHKKSKSKKEKLSDREIVDRYFAKAISQDKDGNSSCSEDQDVSAPPVKHKERSSSKEKSKKKKKSRKHSKDSHNQSHRHTYKKHHSGHKKSSNRLADGLQEHSRHPHTHSPMRQNQVGGPSRSDTIGNENLNQHEPSSSSMSHSVVPGFQPPYIGMADTVQHIPVNLWVSAWPTLSVSHTYPPPPPPPIAMGPSNPQNSNTSSSTMTSNLTCTGEPNRAHLDRLSISSDSSSDSSDSESDDAQDLQIPSLQNVHSRTKQWLETNFPDLGRPQTTSTSVSSNIVNTTSSSMNGNCTISTAVVGSSRPCPQNLPDSSGNGMETNTISKEKETDVVEVVSIASGDDDVVVCSSDDSCSNVDDLWVIDVDDSNKKTSNSPSSNMRGDHITTFPFNNTSTASESAAASSSGPTNIILPPVNKPFQPFKLQKKPALAIHGKDPFFPPMVHSSDEDGEVDGILQSSSCTSNVPVVDEAMPSLPTGLSTVTKPDECSNIDNVEDMAPSAISSVAPLSNILDTKEPQCTQPSNHSIADQPLDTQITISSSLTTTATSSMFSVLPLFTSSSHSAKPNVSTGISYLPYANLPPPTSAASILPYSRQSTIPPPSLSLPLPFHIPLLSTTVQSNNPILPSLYPSQNQGASATSVESISKSKDSRKYENHPLVQTSPSEINNTDVDSLVKSRSHPAVSGGDLYERTCLGDDKMEPEFQSCSDMMIQNDIQNNVVMSSTILSGEHERDKIIVPMETDEEELNACDLNVHGYLSVCENDLPSDNLAEHKKKQLDTEGSTFFEDSSKLKNGALEYAAINIFTPSDDVPSLDMLKEHKGNELGTAGSNCLEDSSKLEDGALRSAVISFTPPDSNFNCQTDGNYEEFRGEANLPAAANSKHEMCVLPTNVSHQDSNDKPLYSFNGHILPTNSTDKPFDALDESMSDDVPVSNSLNLHVRPDLSSASNIVSVKNSMVPTMSERFEQSLPKPTLQSSVLASIDLSGKVHTARHRLYNSETSLPVFKPYSDDNNQPLDQFTDALASSDSDNDK